MTNGVFINPRQEMDKKHSFYKSNTLKADIIIMTLWCATLSCKQVRIKVLQYERILFTRAFILKPTQEVLWSKMIIFMSDIFYRYRH